MTISIEGYTLTGTPQEIEDFLKLHLGWNYKDGKNPPPINLTPHRGDEPPPIDPYTFEKKPFPCDPWVVTAHNEEKDITQMYPYTTTAKTNKNV